MMLFLYGEPHDAFFTFSLIFFFNLFLDIDLALLLFEVLLPWDRS